MDQVTFDFINVALIERVKESPIYCSWKESVDEREFATNRQLRELSTHDALRRVYLVTKYGFIIAANVGRGFQLYCVSESAITSVFKISITHTPFSGSVPHLGLCEGSLSRESIIALHQWLQQIPT